MKCAWYFSTNKDLFAATKANNHADLTTMGMIASKAAYAGGEDWLNQCVDYVNGNHDLALSYIKANIPMIKTYNKAEGTYLMWIDVSQVAERIGAKEKAAARGQGGQDHDAGADRRALVHQERRRGAQPGAHLRPGRREPHAHEHRPVAPDAAGGAQQHAERAQEPRALDRGDLETA